MPRDSSAVDAMSAAIADPVEVLLLGTFHMDNPGLDTVNLEADDVLATDRQRELVQLADVLEDWAPDAIAVERPEHRDDELNALYERYRTGELAYDEEVEIDPVHPDREDPVSECRSEVVQVGFRLADRLAHDCVHAIDHPMTLAAHLDEEELADDELDMAEMYEHALDQLEGDFPDRATVEEAFEEHLRASSILEHHRFLNDPERLDVNHGLMFAGLLAGGAPHYVGARMLGAWYERNLRIVENVWRIVDPDIDRVLLLVGSGHVRPLRHLLAETPMVRPVSARTVLGDG